jgi:hypothetical protein
VGEHEHANGFEHLDATLLGLAHEFDLGIKFERNTDGPVGYPGEPYLLLYVSFAATSGERRPSGTLHYALRRARWQRPGEAVDADRTYLRNLAVERVPVDLQAIDRGDDIAWLTEEGRLYLPEN